LPPGDDVVNARRSAVSRPTELAENKFQSAKYWFDRGITNLKQTQDARLGVADMLGGLGQISEGLSNLAVGLRATYILLEQVNRKLDQQAVVRNAR
jgi:hypothetical protein